MCTNQRRIGNNNTDQSYYQEKEEDILIFSSMKGSTQRHIQLGERERENSSLSMVCRRRFISISPPKLGYTLLLLLQEEEAITKEYPIHYPTQTALLTTVEKKATSVNLTIKNIQKCQQELFQKSSTKQQKDAGTPPLTNKNNSNKKGKK